jgi:hypothetical protein
MTGRAASAVEIGRARSAALRPSVAATDRFESARA